MFIGGGELISRDYCESLWLFGFMYIHLNYGTT